MGHEGLLAKWLLDISTLTKEAFTCQRITQQRPWTSHLADDHARSRMRSEANLAASISHPGVAQVYDYHEGTFSPSDCTYLVLEYVEGHSLAQLLREHGPMAPDQVMSVIAQVAEGLQAVHEAGIVHRDLKPANIMLTPAGRTVLVDFGIARSANGAPLTSTGTLIGTADYMSPEQAAGRSSTAASDLYSLGVVAFHCLTGTSPFRRETEVSTALAHIQDELPNLGSNVPPEMAQLIESLTAKSPSHRPTSAAAVALQAATIGAAAQINLPDTFELSVRPDVSISPPDQFTQPRSRRPIYASISLLVALVALVGFRYMHSAPTHHAPDVIGLTVSDATARIHKAGMKVEVTNVDIHGKQPDRVFKQSPQGGKDELRDSSIQIFVATGKVAVPANQLIGLTYPRASAKLKDLGFTVKRRDVARTTDTGEVIATDKSGRQLDGSTITLSVAVAPAAHLNHPALQFVDILRLIGIDRIRTQERKGKGAVERQRPLLGRRYGQPCRKWVSFRAHQLDAHPEPTRRLTLPKTVK